MLGNQASPGANKRTLSSKICQKSAKNPRQTLILLYFFKIVKKQENAQKAPTETVSL